MANYICTIISNEFEIKKEYEKEIKELLRGLDLEVWDNDNGTIQFGSEADVRIPSLDQELSESYELSELGLSENTTLESFFVGKITTPLAITEIGNEKLRYVVGATEILYPDGRREAMDLQNWVFDKLNIWQEQ